jgi:hypothetical protein
MAKYLWFTQLLMVIPTVDCANYIPLAANVQMIFAGCILPAAETVMKAMEISDTLLVAVSCGAQHSLPVEQTLHQRSTEDRITFRLMRSITSFDQWNRKEGTPGAMGVTWVPSLNAWNFALYSRRRFKVRRGAMQTSRHGRFTLTLPPRSL